MKTRVWFAPTIISTLVLVTAATSALGEEGPKRSELRLADPRIVRATVPPAIQVVAP